MPTGVPARRPSSVFKGIRDRGPKLTVISFAARLRRARLFARGCDRRNGRSRDHDNVHLEGPCVVRILGIVDAQFEVSANGRDEQPLDAGRKPCTCPDLVLANANPSRCAGTIARACGVHVPKGLSTMDAVYRTNAQWKASGSPPMTRAQYLRDVVPRLVGGHAPAAHGGGRAVQRLPQHPPPRAHGAPPAALGGARTTGTGLPLAWSPLHASESLTCQHSVGGRPFTGPIRKRNPCADILQSSYPLCCWGSQDRPRRKPPQGPR